LKKLLRISSLRETNCTLNRVQERMNKTLTVGSGINRESKLGIISASGINTA